MCLLHPRRPVLLPASSQHKFTFRIERVMKRYIAVFFALASFPALAAFGQAVSARLEGVVQDPGKVAVRSVEITAIQQETGVVSKTTTNNKGVYGRA